MKIYQILKRSFFTGSNGCDYAMAIHSKEDILLFTNYIEAKNKFHDLVKEQVEMWWNHNGGKSNKYINCENKKELCAVIYHDEAEKSRTYVSLDIRETL